ncbi:hypothetical protein Tco_0496972, partial [Tanacetum coccineum]
MSPVANSSRVVDANEELIINIHVDQESSTRKRRPKGVNLSKNIPADSSLRKVIHIDISGLKLVFVSENQDQMSTKNESEVGLAQGRTGVNDTREHVQELKRECANMKYEILEVKMKR